MMDEMVGFQSIVLSIYDESLSGGFGFRSEIIYKI